jgi:iron complex transport system ATP-binding protein
VECEESEIVVHVSGVDVWVPDHTLILTGIEWTVRAGEHWALIGPNGSGKSTLLSLLAATRHPSRGSVTVLGERMGQTDVWQLRERIGAVDPLSPRYEWMTVLEVVLTGATGTIQPRWECYGPPEERRADELLELLGCGALRSREIGSCSQGERQRVRIARALMPSPPLLVLDEPATGLDLPAREALILALADLARTQPELATVVVSHHLEELPATISHALLLRDGRMVARGMAAEVLMSGPVSTAFGLPVEVSREQGRWVARAAAGWRP